jgi:hypothetical protein
MNFYPEKKITVRVLTSGVPLYPRYSYFHHFGIFGTYYENEILIVAPPEWSIESNDDYRLLEYAVAHEIIHVLYFEKVVNMVEPAWLQEGLAVYAGFTYIGEDHCTPATVHYLWDEETKFSLDNFYRHSQHVYLISSTIIEFMIEEYGEENFNLFLNTLGEWDLTLTSRQNIDDAFQEAYGLDYAEFEREWLIFLEKYMDEPAEEVTNPEAERITDTEWAEIASSHFEGILLLVTDEKNTLRICSMRLDGSEKKFLTSNTDFNVSDPKWSPDGTKILYTSKEKGNYDVCVMNADGTGKRQLTTHEGIDIAGSWHLDRIAFTSDRSGNYDIFIMNEEGSNVQQLTYSASKEGSPAFSPDGSKIVFVSDKNGNYDIFVMDSDGSNVTQLTKTPKDESFPTFSPDGSKIVFARKDFRTADIVVINSDGTGEEVVYCWYNYDGFHFLTLAPKFPIWISSNQIAFSEGSDIYVIDIGSDYTVVFRIASGVSVVVVLCLLWSKLKRPEKKGDPALSPEQV